MRIAVISDAHGFMEANDRRRSHQKLGQDGTLGAETPLRQLLEFIESTSLRADVLVVPGDLCDQADADAFRAVWRNAQDFASSLGAKLVLGSAGNHDLQSREGQAANDPLEAVKGAQPLFPCIDETAANEYWSRHFTIVDHADSRIVLLNTSAYHTDKTELERGRVSKATVEAISNKLKGRSPKAFNVLVCHHHPHQHMDLGLGETDVVMGGQLLLDQLGRGELGAWLVIHGHKHHGPVTYASGGSSSAVVMSCGIIGIITRGNIANQFHIVELDGPDWQFGASGRIQSWNWTLESAWTPANEDTGLPHECGFGFRGDLHNLSNRVAEQVKSPYSTWEEVAGAVPELRHLVPDDFRLLKRALKAQHKVEMLSQAGSVVQLSRHASESS